MSAAQGFGVGLAAGFGAVFIWGTQIPIAKQVLPLLDGFSLGLFRYVIAMAGFVALLVWKEGWAALSPIGHLRVLTVSGGIGIAGSVMLVFCGLTLTRPESAAIISALQPAMAVLAQWLVYRRRPARFTLACIAVAFIGVVLVVTRGAFLSANDSPITLEEWLGNFLVFCGSMAWVTYSLSTVSIAHWSTVRLSALTSLFGVLVSLPIWGLAYAFDLTLIPATFDAKLAWQVIYLAIAGALIAIYLWNIGLKRIGVLNSVLLSNLVPVIAFATMAVLGSSFSLAELGGAALVVLALAASNLHQRRLRRF